MVRICPLHWSDILKMRGNVGHLARGTKNGFNEVTLLKGHAESRRSYPRTVAVYSIRALGKILRYSALSPKQ